MSAFLARTILIWQKLCVNTCKLILSTFVYNLSFYVLDSSCFNAQGSCMCFSTRVAMFSHLVEATLEFLNRYGCIALFFTRVASKMNIVASVNCSSCQVTFLIMVAHEPQAPYTRIGKKAKQVSCCNAPAQTQWSCIFLSTRVALFLYWCCFFVS